MIYKVGNENHIDLPVDVLVELEELIRDHLQTLAFHEQFENFANILRAEVQHRRRERK